LDLRLGELPTLADNGWDVKPPERAPERTNGQDRVTFDRELRRIEAGRRSLVWRQPSRHEPEEDEAAEAAEAELAGFSELEPISRDTARGGRTRGILLHKLMEEVLAEEVLADAPALHARAAELLAQLVSMPGQPSAGCSSPAEPAEVVLRTLALPAIAALRERLVAEVPVYDCQRAGEAARVETLTSGIADALAMDAGGCIEAVLDWKSDIAPSKRMRRLYREQVRAYLAATGAKRGLVVYMSLAEVDEISVT
ncbi:MAG: PD-(D/E)XK nuclease family protein, partial [Nitrococcus sp.]|nr:PD-(D/E)XK nuclease family protein [Nitrococcus sp.]